jgi:DNA-binding GntR family transcriptional regulator
MSRDEMADLFHVRALLAADAARLAATHAGDGDNHARMAAALQRQLALRASSDLAAYATANVEFHTLIDEMSGNRLLASLLDQLQTRVGPLLSLAQSRSRDRLLEHHVLIAEAILAGDGPAAARTMRRHIRATLQVIMELPQTWFE